MSLTNWRHGLNRRYNFPELVVFSVTGFDSPLGNWSNPESTARKEGRNSLSAVVRLERAFEPYLIMSACRLAGRAVLSRNDSG